MQTAPASIHRDRRFYLGEKMKKTSTTLIVCFAFVLGVFAGLWLPDRLAEARTAPSTSFKNTQETVGVLVEQTVETQNILDKILQQSERQTELLKRMENVADNQAKYVQEISNDVEKIRDKIK